MFPFLIVDIISGERKSHLRIWLLQRTYKLDFVVMCCDQGKMVAVLKGQFWEYTIAISLFLQSLQSTGETYMYDTQITHTHTHTVKVWIISRKRVFAMTSVFSWQHSLSLCPASFYTPKAKLSCYSRISLLPTFAFQFPYDEKDICFWCQFQKLTYL